MEHSVTLRLPDPVFLALRQIALSQDVTIGQVIRDALIRDLKWREQTKAPVLPEDRQGNPSRVLLG